MLKMSLRILWRGRPPPKRKRDSTLSKSWQCGSTGHSRYFCHAPIGKRNNKKLDDGDTPGSTGTLSGSHLGCADLRREQREWLESKHCKKVRPITDITSTALGKEEMAVTMWRLYLLLGNNSVNTFPQKQTHGTIGRPLLGNGSINAPP
jgi:hypothetical protein